jgi:dynein heavy chain
LETIGKNHKINFYNYACRGLFEKDKQLLSLQMAVKLSTDIDKKEYEFFLRGEQMKNPSTVNTINNPYPDWINNWDMICELERQLPNYANMVSSFIHNSKDWKRWYSEDNPEEVSLPLEWETKCDRLRKMIIIKTIRPDRVLAAVNKFVIEKIGDSFVGSPQFNMESIY